MALLNEIYDVIHYKRRACNFHKLLPGCTSPCEESGKTRRSRLPVVGILAEYDEQKQLTTLDIAIQVNGKLRGL